MRVGGRRSPAARPHRGERFRNGVLALEPHDRRFRVGAVRDVLQPTIEEAHELMKVVEVRSRRGDIREVVDPVADDRPRRGGARSLHPEGRIDVRVHPAADVEDRRLDGVVVGRERSGTPVRPVVLLAEPLDEPRWRRVEAGQPFGTPCLAAEGGIGRHGVHRDLADRVLAELARGHAATDVVDVAQVAVVRAHDRDDRAEVRRAQLRDLDRGERAVADPPHPDRPVAPRLGGQPLDGVVAVERLGLGVLVERDAARRAGPADVDPAQGVATPREVRPARDVGVAPPVVLAVRDHLEDRGEALVVIGPVHRAREPEVRRQLDPVARDDAGIPDRLDLVARFACASSVGLV